MSGNGQPRDMAKAVGAGIGGAVAVGGLAGIIASMAFWSHGESVEGFSGMVSKVWSGAVVGALSSLLIGGVLSWHSSRMAAGESHPAGVLLWGVVAGVVVGASMGPLLGGILGWAVGHAVAGIYFGLVIGPVVGALAWESTFFLGGGMASRAAD